jgi:hypothetical protein
MLKIKVNDKLIKITDEKLTKSKINSIKIIIDKYGITEILDFIVSYQTFVINVSSHLS